MGVMMDGGAWEATLRVKESCYAWNVVGSAGGRVAWVQGPVWHVGCGRWGDSGGAIVGSGVTD